MKPPPPFPIQKSKFPDFFVYEMREEEEITAGHIPPIGPSFLLFFCLLSKPKCLIHIYSWRRELANCGKGDGETGPVGDSNGNGGRGERHSRTADREESHWFLKHNYALIKVLEGVREKQLNLWLVTIRAGTNRPLFRLHLPHSLGHSAR